MLAKLSTLPADRVAVGVRGQVGRRARDHPLRARGGCGIYSRNANDDHRRLSRAAAAEQRARLATGRSSMVRSSPSTRRASRASSSSSRACTCAVRRRSNARLAERAGDLHDLRPALAGRPQPDASCPTQSGGRGSRVWGSSAERWRVPESFRGQGSALLAATREQRPRGRDRQAPRLPLRHGPQQHLDQDQELRPTGGCDRRLDRRARAARSGQPRARCCWGSTTAAASCNTSAESAPASTRVSSSGCGALLAPLARKTTPFSGRQPPKGSHFVEPRARLRGRVQRVDPRRDLAPALLQGPARRQARRGVVRESRRSPERRARWPSLPGGGPAGRRR